MGVRHLANRLRSAGFVFNFSSQLLANILSLLVSLVTLPYAARTLGAKGFGDYNLVLSFSSYALVFSSFGFTTYFCREIARLARIADAVNFTVSLRLLLSILSACGLWIVVRLAFADSEELQILAAIMGLNVVFWAFDLRWVFIVKEQLWRVAYMGLVGQIVFSILLFVFVHDSSQLKLYAWIQLTVLIVPVILSNIQYASQFGRLRFSLAYDKHQELRRESLPLGLAALTVALNTTFAGMIVGLCLNTHDLGEYAAGFKLVAVMNQVYVLLATVAVPRISRLYVANRTGLLQFLRMYYSVCCLAGILGGALLFICARFFVHVLFGDQYAQTQVLTQVWSLTYVPLNAIEVFVLSCLVPCNSSKGYLLSLIAGAVVLLAGVPAAALSFGLVAVPVAQGLSELTMIVVGTIVIIRRLRLTGSEIATFFNVSYLTREILDRIR